MVAGWLAGWGAREKYFYKNEIIVQTMMNIFSLTLPGLYSPFRDFVNGSVLEPVLLTWVYIIYSFQWFVVCRLGFHGSSKQGKEMSGSGLFGK